MILEPRLSAPNSIAIHLIAVKTLSCWSWSQGICLTDRCCYNQSQTITVVLNQWPAGPVSSELDISQRPNHLQPCCNHLQHGWKWLQQKESNGLSPDNFYKCSHSLFFFFPFGTSQLFSMLDQHNVCFSGNRWSIQTIIIIRTSLLYGLKPTRPSSTNFHHAFHSLEHTWHLFLNLSVYTLLYFC